MLQLLSRGFHFWVLGYVAACLTSSKISLPALLRAAGVPSRAFLSWGQPCGAQGTGAQWSGTGCLWWLCGICHPSNSLWGERSEQLCRKTQQEAPQGFERRAGTTWQQSWQGGECAQLWLSPAEGDESSPRVRNQAMREECMCWVFLWDQSCLQANVPAPVGWCGFACCSVLPEKLLIQPGWWAHCFDLSLLGISSRAFNKSPIKEVQVGALCFFNT